jgi:hypothetical protein
MLIKIPKIYINDIKEEVIDIWINSDKIIKIEPLDFKNSIAKSHITIKNVEPWNSIKSTLTPDEIADRVNYPKRGKTTNYTPYKSKRRPENETKRYYKIKTVIDKWDVDDVLWTSRDEHELLEQIADIIDEETGNEAQI